MNKVVLTFVLLFGLIQIAFSSKAQQNGSIRFQGIARDAHGFILADKVFNIRIGITADTNQLEPLYQELVALKTDHLGYFSTNIGEPATGKIILGGSFDLIPWDTISLYIHVEIDIENNLEFTSMGFEKITAAPIAFTAKMVAADNIKGILAIEKGGTGTNSVENIKTLLNWESKLNKTDTMSLSNRINLKLNKVDTNTLSNRINLKLNRSDFNKDTLVKMLSNTSLDIDTIYLSNRINLKLNKADTNTLSNRINLKLNRSDFNKDTLVKILSNTSLDIDTIYLSNRINLKLNKSDTLSLNNRINLKLNKVDFTADSIIKLINYVPKTLEYGSFYDTSRQLALPNTAIAVIWNFSNSKSNIFISNNTSGNPTKINNISAGVYEVYYQLQCIKSDIGTEEISVWFRKNGSAYPITNKNSTITGGGFKNIISGNYFIELGPTDYIELFYSVRSSNVSLQSTATQSNPSRPMTAAAYIQINKIN